MHEAKSSPGPVPSDADVAPCGVPPLRLGHQLLELPHQKFAGLHQSLGLLQISESRADLVYKGGLAPRFGVAPSPPPVKLAWHGRLLPASCSHVHAGASSFAKLCRAVAN